MAKFNYKAKNFEGKVVSGSLEGESKEAVVSRLRERGFFVTEIKEKSKELSFFAPKVTTRDVSLFCRQFATMIGAGVPLVRCLNILQEQCENPTLRDIIGKIKVDVESGATFSAALEKYPKVFNKLFINLVKAGEAGGILDEILDRLAKYLEEAESLRAKVKGALTYPVVVVFIAGGVVVFLLTAVLPSFKNIFDGMGNIELPLPTKILLDTSAFMQNYFLLLAVVIGGAVVLLKQYFATKQGERVWDTMMINMPVVGLMLRKVAVSKFTRTLGTLISSGVPILQALEVTSNASGNVIIAEAVDKTKNSIKEGESIAVPLRQSNVFPPMVVQMISVGEETGELDGMLAKIADFYDAEVDTAIKGLTSIIEPIIIVFLGVVIGGIVMAIFLPMMKLVNAG